MFPHPPPDPSEVSIRFILIFNNLQISGLGFVLRHIQLIGVIGNFDILYMYFVICMI